MTVVVCHNCTREKCKDHVVCDQFARLLVEEAKERNERLLEVKA